MIHEAISIGTICGVSIRVHLLFVALLAVLLLQALDFAGLAGLAWFAMQLLLLFASLLAHELGHALAARALGVRVYDIVMSPFGGMARLERLPENPRIELLIAAAGPAASLTLAAVLIALQVLLSSAPLWPAGPVLTWNAFHIALVVNLLMGCVNLIPAFPMDGGRIFRALLARRMAYAAATRIAVLVGRWVALALLLIALSHRSLLALALLALFLWVIGDREQRLAETRASTEPHAAEGGDLGRAGSPEAQRFLLLCGSDEERRARLRSIDQAMAGEHPARDEP